MTSINLIKESLFRLTTPQAHIDFHNIDYWTSTICSLWHISRRNPLPPRRLLYSISTKGWYALSHRQDSCGPLVGTENSPNCKCNPPYIRIQTFTADSLTAWAISGPLYPFYKSYVWLDHRFEHTISHMRDQCSTIVSAWLIHLIEHATLLLSFS